MKGRKPKQECRSAEFRRALIDWKRIWAPQRPSLRALARELGTSHQLLQHYLDGLDKWQQEERQRKAKLEIEEIRARARAENRPLTWWEEERIRVCDRVALRAMAGSLLLGQFQKLKRKAKHSPLHPGEIKILELYVRHGLPGARELLQECSQGRAKNRKNNLPVIHAGEAKSFRMA